MAESKFLVQVGAPSKEALSKLQAYDIDLFRHTARQTSKTEFKIDGFLTADQAAQLVKDGYTVQMQQEAYADAQGASAVIELPEWLRERGF